jgi:DNA-binding Xre family transcriptional regulator
MKNATKAERYEGPESIDWTRARRVVGRGRKTGRRYTLATLRVALGKTQTEIAARAKMSQGDVSVLENREDVKLSTLARYAAALGGRIETAVVIGDRRYLLDLGR